MSPTFATARMGEIVEIPEEAFCMVPIPPHRRTGRTHRFTMLAPAQAGRGAMFGPVAGDGFDAPQAVAKPNPRTAAATEVESVRSQAAELKTEIARAEAEKARLQSDLANHTRGRLLKAGYGNGLAAFAAGIDLAGEPSRRGRNLPLAQNIGNAVAAFARHIEAKGVA